MALVNSASHSFQIWIDQLKQNPPESCRKDVTKQSKTSVGWPRFGTQECNVFCACFPPQVDWPQPDKDGKISRDW